jgi:hypothetical protein
MDALLAHDVLHVPHPWEIELELPAKLCFRRRQLVAGHELEQISARSEASVAQCCMPTICMGLPRKFIPTQWVLTGVYRSLRLKRCCLVVDVPHAVGAVGVLLSTHFKQCWRPALLFCLL